MNDKIEKVYSPNFIVTRVFKIDQLKQSKDEKAEDGFASNNIPL